MIELKIDPEFRDKIPPLTDAEFEQLRENILADGEVYEPLVVWNGTIVDGHNRYKIIQEHPEIPYRTKEVSFANRWAAIAWMCKNQLGRRNLSDNDRTYLMGKRNEAEKMAVGTNRYSKKEEVQNGPLKIQGKTAQRIADEYGVGYGTVVRAEKFAKGIDALKDVSPEAAEKVMHGKTTASKADIAEIAQMDKVEQAEAAQAILSDIPIKKDNRRGWTKADREDRAKLEAIVADMYDPSTVPEFTLDLLIDDIQLNAQNYVDLLRNTLKDRSTLLTNENKPKIAEAIQKYVIDELLKVKELVEK